MFITFDVSPHAGRLRHSMGVRRCSRVQTRALPVEERRRDALRCFASVDGDPLGVVTIVGVQRNSRRVVRPRRVRPGRNTVTVLLREPVRSDSLGEH